MKNKIPLIISAFSLIIAVSTYFYLENEIEILYNDYIDLKKNYNETSSELMNLKQEFQSFKLSIAETPQEEEDIRSNDFYSSLNSEIFLTDFDNYKFSESGSKITSRDAGKIAEKGFERSALFIASEGADDVDSQTIKSQEVCANTYFTKLPTDGYKMYQNIKRNCYIVTRENEMGCGISVYVDSQTGLIIGGEAYGD